MISKSLNTRILDVCNMLSKVAQLDTVYTYAGGTWPYIVEIYSISIDGKYVYINGLNNKDSFIKGRQRYNTNNADQLECLKYDLSVIYKAFKKSLK